MFHVLKYMCAVCVVPCALAMDNNTTLSSRLGFQAIPALHDSTQVPAKYRLTTPMDHSALLWDASGRCVLELKGHTHWVKSASISPDETRIATVSVDGSERIWDAKSGECLQVIEGNDHKGSSVNWVSTTTMPSSMAAALKATQALTRSTGSVRAACFNHAGNRLIYALNNGSIRAWDVIYGKCQQVQAHEGIPVDQEHSHIVGKYRLTTPMVCTALLWDASGNCMLELKGHTHWVKSACINRDEMLIATVSVDGTARIWDAQNGKCLYILTGEEVVDC